MSNMNILFTLSRMRVWVLEPRLGKSVCFHNATTRAQLMLASGHVLNVLYLFDFIQINIIKAEVEF